MGQIQQFQSADNGTPENYRIVLSAAEILALDNYFTWRVGYIGHDDASDDAAHALANIISQTAEEIREADENDRD